MSQGVSEHENIIRQVDPEDQEKESEGLTCEEVVEESDGLEQHKKSLAGFLGHVSTKLKNAKTCLADSRDSELENALKSLNLAWNNYDSCYKTYVTKDLPEGEHARVNDRFTEAKTEYDECTNAISERLLKLKSQNIPKEKSKSKSVPSSRQSKLKELKKDIKMRKLVLKQEQELAQHEMEMERKKIEMEFENKRKACEMKFRIQIAEKEAERLEQDGSETASNDPLEDKGGILLMPPMTEQEKIDRWSAKCDVKPLSPEAPNFMSSQNPPAGDGPTPVTKVEPSGKENPPESSPSVKTNTQRDDNTAIMLKLTLLQAMQPVKFSGNPSDYPTFRNRLRDNLEDNILNDSQKLEFLPKFLTGEAYELIERVAGCSDDAVLNILHDRYGQPTTVATACIENLTNGQRLANNDFTGLQNFAEQLESASKKLSGESEQEASTMTNLRQIVRRLPSYLVNKWGEVSYRIREGGASPRLSDLAKFVKRQAAIKNDPGFVVDKKFKRQKESSTRSPGSHLNRQTSSFATDFKASGATASPQKSNKPNFNRCLRCSSEHELTECEQFRADEIQGRWDIVKRHKL